MATVAHPHLDPAEFLALQAHANWTLPVELIAGEAVVIPPSGGHAASAQGEFYYALRRWQEASGDGGLLLQDVFVTFPGGQYVAPDIAWWNARRRPQLSDGAFAVVPDLVVEVLSPKTRDNDRGAKRDLYLASGVRELWLVDPPAQTVTLAATAGDAVLTVGDTLSSSLLDRFTLAVSSIFRG